MIHPDEAAFYAYWEKERALPHYKRKPFLRGFRISLLMGWIYQQFTWEMNEQRFNEIKHLKNKKSS
jgi:hypothetical protein